MQSVLDKVSRRQEKPAEEECVRPEVVDARWITGDCHRVKWTCGCVTRWYADREPAPIHGKHLIYKLR